MIRTEKYVKLELSDDIELTEMSKLKTDCPVYNAERKSKGKSKKKYAEERLVGDDFFLQQKINMFTKKEL